MSSTDAAGLREAIRSEVSAIKPLDDTEGLHQADALAWIGSGAGLFRTTKPATPPKHLVSYFAVVDDGHILLVAHRSAGLWLANTRGQRSSVSCRRSSPSPHRTRSGRH